LIWELVEKEDIPFADNISFFHFETDKYQVKNYLPGVHWFGKYFIVILILLTFLEIIIFLDNKSEVLF